MSRGNGVAVLKAIAVTAELTGTELSEPALRVFEARLSDYPEKDVLTALEKCQLELRSRLTLADVLDRIRTSGGHPSGNEAWAIGLAGQDESTTVVWTEQIAEAMAVAQPILDIGDESGARVAFRDCYDRKLREIGNERPRWFASLGCDPGKRQVALDRAVADGRLRREHADGLLPPPINAKGLVIAGLLTGDIPAQMPRDPEFKARIDGLLKQLKRNKAA